MDQIKLKDLTFEKLTNEIERANSKCRGFFEDPIYVTISSPDNQDLTLIDFPGVVAEPEDRAKIIEMIKPVIKLETAIILAVSR